MPRIRPTHFLSIPLGQIHAGLRAKIAAFADALDSAYQPIVVAPSRAHLTLGVMSLSSKDGSKSVKDALALLRRLPALLSLTDVPPSIQLDHIDVLKRDGKLRRAHVLYLSSRRNEQLYTICTRIHAIFRKEGFITESRSLKLHMTLMNTKFSRPTRGHPQPFSFDALIGRPMETLGILGDVVEGFDLPKEMSWGTYEAPSLHLCSMGSHAPDGAYVSLGRVPLIDVRMEAPSRPASLTQ